jgi:hypothetical protein
MLKRCTVTLCPAFPQGGLKLGVLFGGKMKRPGEAALWRRGGFFRGDLPG